MKSSVPINELWENDAWTFRDVPGRKEDVERQVYPFIRDQVLGLSPELVAKKDPEMFKRYEAWLKESNDKKGTG